MALQGTENLGTVSAFRLTNEFVRHLALVIREGEKGEMWREMATLKEERERAKSCGRRYTVDSETVLTVRRVSSSWLKPLPMERIVQYQAVAGRLVREQPGPSGRRQRPGAGSAKCGP